MWQPILILLSLFFIPFALFIVGVLLLAGASTVDYIWMMLTNPYYSGTTSLDIFAIVMIGVFVVVMVLAIYDWWSRNWK